MEVSEKKYHGNRTVWEGNWMLERWASSLMLMISNFIQFTLNTELWTRADSGNFIT